MSFNILLLWFLLMFQLSHFCTVGTFTSWLLDTDPAPYFWSTSVFSAPGVRPTPGLDWAVPPRSPGLSCGQGCFRDMTWGLGVLTVGLCNEVRVSIPLTDYRTTFLWPFLSLFYLAPKDGGEESIRLPKCSFAFPLTTRQPHTEAAPPSRSWLTTAAVFCTTPRCPPPL